MKTKYKYNFDIDNISISTDTEKVQLWSQSGTKRFNLENYKYDNITIPNKTVLVVKIPPRARPNLAFAFEHKIWGHSKNLRQISPTDEIRIICGNEILSATITSTLYERSINWPIVTIRQ
jgi:hypothetical protein